MNPSLTAPSVAALTCCNSLQTCGSTGSRMVFECFRNWPLLDGLDLHLVCEISVVWDHMTQVFDVIPLKRYFFRFLKRWCLLSSASTRREGSSCSSSKKIEELLAHWLRRKAWPETHNVHRQLEMSSFSRPPCHANPMVPWLQVYLGKHQKYMQFVY